MLQYISEGAKGGIGKIIIFGFIGLGAAGLVLTDVQGFFSGNISARNVAEVADSAISTQEYDARLRLRLHNQGVTPQEAHGLGLTARLLQNMVSERLLKRAAIDFGLQVPREVVAQEVDRVLSAATASGTFSRKEALARILRAQNMSERQFVAGLGQDTATRLLDRALFETVYTPDALAKDLKIYDDHTRDIKAVFFRNKDVKDIDKPSGEDLKAFYELRKNQFTIPEYRSFEYVTISPESVKVEFKVSDEDIKQFYDDNILSYTSNTQRKIEQALFASAEEAREAYSLAKKSGSLKEAITTVKGSELGYTQPDWFEEEGLPEELGAPIFKAKLNTLLEPINSPLGWHVIKTLEEKASQTQSLSEVKKDIAKTLEQELSSETLFNLTEEIDDALAGGDSITTISENYNLKRSETPLITIGGISRKGVEPFSELENINEILTEGFDLESDLTSQLIEANEGVYIAIAPLKIENQGFEKFEDVKSRLTDLWIEEEKRKNTFSLATQITARSQSGTETLKDIAKDLGGRVISLNALKNTGKTQDILSGPNVQLAFDLAYGDDPQLFSNAQGNGVMVLDKINLRKTPVLEKDIVEDAQALTSTFRESIFQSFMLGLYRKYNVKLNTSALDSLYARDPLDQNY